jgi:hypothetical protein
MGIVGLDWNKDVFTAVRFIRDREHGRNSSTEAVGCIIDTRPGRQNGNPGLVV